MSMTAETSNAREWVLVPRVPDADMLDAAVDAHIGFNGEDEVDAVWAAMLAAAPPPAAARGDVRGLVALAKRVQYADTHAQVSKDDAGEFVCLPPWLWLEIRDAAAEALAAEGVQAGEVEQQPEARGVVDCPTCGAPAVRSEREGVLEIEDVYRYAPEGDSQHALIGAAFLTVLRDPDVMWRDRPQADEFINRVAETCAEQNPAFAFKSALTGERNG